MHYCQSWEQSLWFWALLIKEHLFLPYFLFSSHIPLIWSCTQTHLATSNLSTCLSGFVLFHLFLFTSSCSCCFTSSAHMTLPPPSLSSNFSPILNIQTYKTPFSYICLSNYSHHVSIMKAQMRLLCGVSLSTVDLLNLLPRFLVFTTCRSERTSSSQSVVVQHSYISLSKSCSLGLCYSVLSGSPSNFLSDSSLFPSKDLLHFSLRLV